MIDGRTVTGIDYRIDRTWRAGYDLAARELADQPRDVLADAARRIDDDLAKTTHGSTAYRVLAGARAYLTERATSHD